MQCDKCRNTAVFFQSSSGRHLCGRHLSADIEARAKRAIRSHRWLETGDHIAVILTGDKKSAALVVFLKRLIADRHDIRLSAVPPGDTGGCSDARSAALRIAESLRVPCIRVPRTRSRSEPEDSVTKLALAFTLDDISREVLVRFLSGDAENLVHPPLAGTGRISVICPFIGVPSEELDIYWDHEGTYSGLLPCLPVQDSLSRDVETLMNDYYHQHPATRFALLNLAEKLSGGNVGGIAAAAPCRDRDGHRRDPGKVPCDGA